MKNFVPDSRNYGGRKVITDEFKHHYEKMANAKAALQTRPKYSSGFSQGINSPGRSVLQRQADNSYRISRGNKSLLTEHLLNIKHMNRRIKSIGSYNERKKNPFDPITHPVVFFRHNQESPELVLNQQFIAKSIRPPKISKIYENHEEPESRARTSMEKHILVPYIEKSEKNPGNKLKSMLCDTIVKHRIYKEEDLQELFSCAKEANNHLGRQVLDKVIAIVYQEFSN